MGTAETPVDLQASSSSKVSFDQDLQCYNWALKTLIMALGNLTWHYDHDTLSRLKPLLEQQSFKCAGCGMKLDKGKVKRSFGGKFEF